MKNFGIVLLGIIMMSCTTHAQKQEKSTTNKKVEMNTENMEIATFGGGCFGVQKQYLNN